MSDANSFVGAGWHWPLTTDQTGAVALVSGTTELEQAMYLVLATNPGERLDERDARVGDVVVGPLRAAQLQVPLRLVDELLERAVVQAGRGQRHARTSDRWAGIV